MESKVETINVEYKLVDQNELRKMIAKNIISDKGDNGKKKY